MANNQNLYVEYEWHLHFRNLTVELYKMEKMQNELKYNDRSHMCKKQISLISIVFSTGLVRFFFEERINKTQDLYVSLMSTVSSVAV